MAYHFSAHQFEDQYSPRKLGNWEYPKWYPDRPRQRFKSTKVIADNNGHLLDGIKGENAWGNYVGTWDLPRRITREYAKKLAAPPERLIKLWGKKKPCTEQQPQPTPEPTKVKEEEERCKICNNLLTECSCKKQSKTKSSADDEEVETCGEPLYCPKCNHELCFCEDKCPCPSQCLPTLDPNLHSSAETSFQKRNKSCSALALRPRPTKLEPLVALEAKNDDPLSIEPGTLNEDLKNILDSVQDREKDQLGIPEFVCKETKALPGSSSMVETVLEGERSTTNRSNQFLNNSDNHLDRFEGADTTFYDEKQPREKSAMGKSSKTPENDVPAPSKNGYSGFQIAKRFHDENLRHKPLPDVIDDPVFKALNSGKHAHPGGALTVDPLPSAIGWKPYSAPRPTECSKLKVFRPKTGVEMQKPQKEPRPKTGDFAYKKRFLPIDLAICWDLKPDDPSEEPKRSPHIDGSNGSAAPAVFTMIRPIDAQKQDDNVPGSSQALVERITKGIDEDNVATLPSQLNGKVRSPTSLPSNKEAILTCIKPPKESSPKQSAGSPESPNSISPNAAEYARRHPKTAWTKEDTSRVLSDKLECLQKANEKNALKNSPSGCPSESPQLTRNKCHQSTPNLVCNGSHCGTEKNSPASGKNSNPVKMRSSADANAPGDENNFEPLTGDKTASKNERKKRNCSACKKPNSDCSESREKTEFKAAFKAGVPRSDSTNSGSSSTAKSYKVPKMRLPYAKRSYSIGTLAPPFSLWRESNGQEYPEHWRLASVYQHSYKPINCRKRPLLASVYQ